MITLREAFADALGFARMIFRSPTDQINLDAIAAAGRLEAEIAAVLATPKNQADLVLIRKALETDFPASPGAVPAPAPDPIAKPLAGNGGHPSGTDRGLI